MIKRIFIFIATIASLALWSCKEDEPDPLPDTPGDDTEQPDPPAITRRTLLVYMVADNSLGRGKYDRQDLDQMHEGVDDGALGGDCRLLVYYNRPGTSEERPPQLVEILPGQAEEKVLKEYPEDGTLYSTDAERMTEVLADAGRIAPAEDFGIVLWSHATGWMQEETARAPVLRSFGEDRKQRMSVTTLAGVLEKVQPSFVYFDCCLMATVEVVYEMRHATPVIVASGAEVHGDGMPYHLTLKDFFAEGPADMAKVAKTTFDFYNEREGVHRWCTISVIDTSKLDRLAAVSRRIMTYGAELSKNNFQRYSPSNRYRIFDMTDYFSSMIDLPAAELVAYQAALDEALLYKANTPKVNGTWDIDMYCGLGCNIVSSFNDAADGHYNQTAWWRDVVSHNPLFKQP